MEQNHLNYFEPSNYEPSQSHYEQSQSHYEQSQSHYEQNQSHYEQNQSHYEILNATPVRQPYPQNNSTPIMDSSFVHQPTFSILTPVQNNCSSPINSNINNNTQCLALNQKENQEQSKTIIKFKKSYTLQQKLDVIHLYDDLSEDFNQVIEKTNLSARLVREWVRNRAKIEESKGKLIKRRVSGGGRKPLSPNLDRLLLEFVRNERTGAAKSRVSLKKLKEQAITIAKSIGLNNFRCAPNYINGFMERNGLSYRSTTHRSQQNNKTPETKFIEVIQYLNEFNNSISNYELDEILNMDETPMYFDLVSGKTIDQLGAKSVEVCHTGSDKMRFTLVITITASGVILPGYIIWKGLVKSPLIFKTKCPANLVMAASESGTMDQTIMTDYFQRIIKPYVESIRKKKCLLLLDEARSHNTPDIQKYLKENECNPIYVPGGYTDCCQPLDVSVNKPVKSFYREHYEKWQANKDAAEFQPFSGNRKRPGYDVMAEWVSESLLKIESESIKLSFAVCGMCYADYNRNGLAFISALNSRLKAVLFINKNSTIYEQFIGLFYMITNKFSERSKLLIKIQEYIMTYKPRYRVALSERADAEDSIDIEFDELCINDMIEHQENHESVVNIE